MIKLFGLGDQYSGEIFSNVRGTKFLCGAFFSELAVPYHRQSSLKK